MSESNLKKEQNSEPKEDKKSPKSQLINFSVGGAIKMTPVKSENKDKKEGKKK